MSDVHSHEVSSPRALFLTWVALMVLAGLSFGLRFVSLGWFGFVAALGIAAIKAILVALVFMEIAYERLSVRLAFLAGLSLFAIMLALMLGDILTRRPAPLENPPGTAQRYRG